MTMRRWLFATAVVVTVGAASTGARGGGGPAVLLPDLDQRPPLNVSVRWGGPPTRRRPRLVFASNVENVGFGSLVVVGRREDPREQTMRAEQLVRLRDGGLRVIAGVGRLHYNVSPSHSHWHLQPFEHYELRTLSGRRLVRDHKSGFCLTSDHKSPLPTLGTRGAPVDSTHCRKNRADALRVREGIAVGWGDLYVPAKEGQYIDIAGLAYGDYDLVHRVNVGRRLRETNYANDAASARISLQPPPRPSELPRVVVVSSCETGVYC